MEEVKLPKCPVCLQPYDAVSAVPRVLTCGHTTCEGCLKQLLSPSPNTLRCTVCTQLIKIPNSISALPKNLDLLHFSSVLENLLLQSNNVVKMSSSNRRRRSTRGRGGEAHVDTPIVETPVVSVNENPTKDNHDGSIGPIETPSGPLTQAIPEQIMIEFVKTLQTMVTKMGHTRSLREFLDLDPPAFHGEPNPMAAERWLRQITRNLDILQISDGAMRVSFAVHQLKDDAYHWWRSVEDKVGDDFDAFSRVFLKSYFPKTARDAIRQQFIDLIQGDVTVAEYDAKFTSLARFANELVATEELRCEHFERGLRISIRERVVALRIRTYSELVSAATAVEQTLHDMERELSTSQGNVSSSEGHFAKRHKPSGVTSFTTQTNRSVPAASMELIGSVPQSRPPLTCYTCGQPGHKSFDCPQKDQQCVQSQRTPRPQSQKTSQNIGWLTCYKCGQIGHFSRQCPQNI